MPRVIAIVAFVLLFGPAFAQAQEASPTPSGTPPAFLGPLRSHGRLEVGGE